MELIGEIADIIYKNEVNSYLVANLETDEEVHTVVGYLPFIGVGDNVRLIGKFVTHQEYGKQFKIDTFEKLMPQTLDALERYLASGNIKGIGPATARKIIKQFGEETISIFKFEPEKLAKIKGITKTKAIEMANEFNENLELWQIVGFLDKFGIPASSAQSIYKKLGTDTIKKIEENPYILVDLSRGIDFKQIDKMALNLGIDYNNPERIQNGIKYSLNLISLNGHTCVLKSNLIEFVHGLLNIEQDLIDSEIINLRASQIIVIEEQEEEWVYLMPFYKAEQNIADRLLILNNAKNIKHIVNLKKELKLLQKESDIELSEKQLEAINVINNNNVCVITGGPGTGKTTIIKTVIDLYKKKGKKVALCAPTGRAAKRMEETTGNEAKTLHRLLEIGKIKDELGIDNVDYETAPIDADVIIVDEVSMVDVFLMNYLVKAIYLGTKLVLVGDVDQLASVGPGSVLKDIIESKQFEVVKLDKIFRQAALSKIVLNAHNVNKGENFITKKEDKSLKEDFFYINENNQEKILYNVLSLCKDRLKNYGNYDFFKNIQVITPSKRGKIGTRELNKYLQQELNPKSDHKKEKVSGNTIFRQGDRVMQVKNNYDIYWEKHEKESEFGSGIFNGEFGTIMDINEEEKQLQVKYDDGKIAWYAFQDLEELEHSYAITVHKSQGSEFDVVILPITASSPLLLTRNLLYTAITRAKKLLIVIGENKIIENMIANFDSKKRNTGLKYKLLNYKNLSMLLDK